MVVGDLVVGGALNLVVNATTSNSLSVSGCVNLSGPIRIQISDVVPGSEVKALSYGCFTGAFPPVTVSFTPKDPSIDLACYEYSVHELVVLFQLDSSRCGGPDAASTRSSISLARALALALAFALSGALD